MQRCNSAPVSVSSLCLLGTFEVRYISTYEWHVLVGIGVIKAFERYKQENHVRRVCVCVCVCLDEW